MVEQVVGLRFVAEGAAEATASIKRLDQSQASLTGSISKSYGITKRTEAEVRKLTGAYVGGNLNLKQYYQALSQTSNAYGQFLGNTTLSRQQVEQLSSALLEEARSQGESTRAKAAAAAAARSAAISAKQEADSIRQYADARRQANEANRRFDSEQKNSAAAAARLEKAILDQGRAFAEAVRGATQYTQANKSAEGSASVFEAELRKQEAAFQRTAKVNQEYLRSLQTANQANKSAEGSASVFSAELRKQEAAFTRTARANQEYMRSLQTANQANKSAESSASVFEAELRRQEAAVERLSMKYKPLYAASKQYERSLEELNSAHALNVLSAKQHEQAVERLATEYQQFQSGTAGWSNQFVKGSDKAKRSTNSMGVAVQQTGYQVGDFLVQVQSGTNPLVAFGQQATQLVGVLPLVAGSLGLTTAAAIGLSTALGIGIPLVTAIGAYFMRTKKDADEAEESIKSLSDALDSLSSTSKSTAADVSVYLSKAFGSLSDEVQMLIDDLREAEFSVISRKMRTEIESATKELTRLGGAFDVFFEDFMNPGSVDSGYLRQTIGIIRESGLAYEEFVRLDEAVKSVFSAGTTNDFISAISEARSIAAEIGGPTGDAISQALLKAAQDAGILNRVIGESSGAAEILVKEQEKLNSLLEAGRSATLDRNRVNRQTLIDAKAELKLAQTVAEFGSESVQVATLRAQQEAISLNLTTENAEKYVHIMLTIRAIRAAQSESNFLMDEAVQKYNDIKASAEGRIAQYERETALNQAILDYGKNSVQVEELKRTQAMAVVEAMIKQEQLGDELAKRMRDAAAAAYDTSVAVDSINLSPAVAQANAFADAMGRARSNASGIGISTAGINAQIAALESGASQVEARAQGAAETVRARLTAELPAADRGAKSSDRIDRVAQRTYEEELKKGVATERLQKLTATTSSGGGSSGGAAKSNVIDIQEIIAKRNEQIAQERVLLGLTGQQRAEMEIYYDLTKGMSDEQLASSEQFVMAEAKKIAALQQTNDALKEQRAEQQQIADTLQSSMSDAFMSMVDGTKSFKDAMKDMARAVIKQLFEVLVVQRLVGSFNATTGVGSGIVGSIMGALQADGGAWRAGSQITAYANGGVVGGPTYFPMSGGKTGLMGEAGPEAIMPLKRGKDGKLGVAADGGGAVTVSQSFYFTANGDESVKRIIQQEAPRIASLTQKQIMDQRKRGGSMKATFG